MAYGIEGLRGSGFDSRPRACSDFWADRPRRPRPVRLLRPRLLRRLHARLPVRAVAGRRPASATLASAAIGDLIKLPAIITDVVLAYVVYRMVLDLGVTSGRAPARGDRRARQPDHLVRLGDLGPGRQLRDGVPAARRPRAVEGPAGAGRDPRGRPRRSSSRSWRSSSRSSRSSSSGGRCGRPAATATSRRPSARASAGSATARLDPDPDDRRRGVRDGGRPVGAVRPVGGLVHRRRRRSSKSPSCGSCSAPRRRTPTSPSTPTTCGRCSRVNGESTATNGPVDPRRADGPTPAHGPQIGPFPAVVVGGVLLGLLLFVIVPALVARRPDRLTILVGVCVLVARVLRGADPRPRALPVPAVRPRGDPVRVLVALAGRVPGRDPRDVHEHVRRPRRRSTAT